MNSREKVTRAIKFEKPHRLQMVSIRVRKYQVLKGMIIFYHINR
jgi:hypothetical protein